MRGTVRAARSAMRALTKRRDARNARIKQMNKRVRRILACLPHVSAYTAPVNGKRACARKEIEKRILRNKTTRALIEK